MLSTPDAGLSKVPGVDCGSTYYVCRPRSLMGGWGEERDITFALPRGRRFASEGCPEVKRVPAAPGRAAASETVMATVTVSRMHSLFHMGETDASGGAALRLATVLLVHSFEGSPVFNPAASSTYFSFDPDLKELNFAEVDLVWCANCS